MARALELDSLSNQNITTALEVGSYTADAARLVFIRLLVDQVAGNGDYTAYATLQVNGSGSAYRLIPITAAAAASGTTAVGFISLGIPADPGDIIKVYVLGLAGDTTTPDTACKFYENDYLRPTTADRTLDVSSGGEAGLDWANVGSPTTTVNLSGTTVKTATDVEADTDAILLDTGTDGVVVASASKSGYALAATGLDSITATDPGGVASTFPQMVVQLWRRFFKKTTLTSTQLKTYADDGSTVRTTQTVSDDGSAQTQGTAS